MNKILYIPADATSLAHYISGAGIKPAMFYSNKPKDIQDVAPGHLLMLSENGYTGSECSLEIELLEEEAKKLRPLSSKGWFLFDHMIPITRVKSIYFTDRVKSELVLTNIEMSTAFLPKRLIKLVDSFKVSQAPEVGHPDSVSMEYAGLNEIFDHLLGAFCMMRTTSQGGALPPAYFGLLGRMCPRVADEARYAYKDKYVDRYGSLISRNVNDSIKWLATDITDDVVRTVAKNYGLEIEYDELTRMIKLDGLADVPYVYAILNMYGVGQEARQRKVDELVLSNFTRGIRPNKSELVATYYGYNRGYSAFPKLYRSTDGRKTVATKFELNNLVDYFTIECVYRYLFLGIDKVRCEDMERSWPRKSIATGRAYILDYTIPVHHDIELNVQINISKATSPTDSWLNSIVKSEVEAFDRYMGTLFSFGTKVARRVYDESNARRPVKRIASRAAELSAKSLAELKSIGSMYRIPDFRKMSKQELVVAIVEAEESGMIRKSLI